MRLIILTVILLWTIVCDDYQLVFISQDKQAACLDGSPPAYYYRQGKGINKNKFMVYFQGGGDCGQPTLSSTLESCYNRSFTQYGSTKNIPSSRNFDSKGILSTLEQNNPLFYDWTLIYVIYCDGSDHQGYRPQSIQFKDKKLYFRGNKNTQSTFNALQEKFDLFNQDTIVFSGFSAGSMAIYVWANYIYQHVKPTSKVYLISDSGIFLGDFYSPIQQKYILRQRVTILFNNLTNPGYPSINNFPIPSCVQQFKGDVVSCLNPLNLVKYYHQIPMLIVQSEYDAYSVGYIVGLQQCLKNSKQPYNIGSCSEQGRNLIEQYRNQTIKAIKVILSSNKKIGVWSIGCVQHGFINQGAIFDNNYRIPGKTGISLNQAIKQFLKDPNNPKSYIDQESWPQNSGCNGIGNTSIQNQQNQF